MCVGGVLEDRVLRFGRGDGGGVGEWGRSCLFLIFCDLL